MKHIGSLIRQLRRQKGLSTIEFAQELGVSVGYLNNLETGQTETIRISLLEKLPLKIELSLTNSKNGETDHHLQIQSVSNLLQDVQHTHPVLVDYYIRMIEEGISLHLDQSFPKVGNHSM